MSDCMSVREKIENALNTLCYRTTDLNKQTLLDALEHTICYQTNSVVDVPMYRIHVFIGIDRNATVKAIESRLNRCKKDFILSLSTEELITVFGTSEHSQLKDTTEHEFVMHVARFVVNNW